MKLRSRRNADVNNWCSKWRKSLSDSTQRWNVRHLLSGSETLDEADRHACCRTMQRLTSDFTSVIEESCRHVPTGAQERPPPLQAHCYLCARGKGWLEI
ncbi:hypothetical protein QQF64_035481 [Cirrhinus molitorella]|uniref:Uncharacterized protein n=1 Tax=Cirrhinus molitorella TaxID=172907 RepID=A0ABR3NGN0_9TELE